MGRLDGMVLALALLLLLLLMLILVLVPVLAVLWLAPDIVHVVVISVAVLPPHTRYGTPQRSGMLPVQVSVAWPSGQLGVPPAQPNVPPAKVVVLQESENNCRRVLLVDDVERGRGGPKETLSRLVVVWDMFKNEHREEMEMMVEIRGNEEDK